LGSWGEFADHKIAALSIATKEFGMRFAFIYKVFILYKWFK
jgi:hypothetical protein